MNRADDMRMLVETVDKGGFSAAAKRLGVSKQLVSRRISELEARLGARLLVRTTRRLRTTDLGQDYLDRAKRILADIDEAEAIVSGHAQTPRGRLRLSAPVSFGTSHLSNAITLFLRTHPAVEVELDLNDRSLDLVAEGYDMAIRIGVLGDSTLNARKLVDTRLLVCASPDYLARRGIPRRPEDLKAHDCLLYGHDRGVSWPFVVEGRTRAVEMTGSFRANNGDLVRDAAVAGLGIAHLPDFIIGEALRAGKLVSLLNDFVVGEGAAYAVRPAHRQHSPNIRALTNHLVEYFESKSGRTSPS